MLLLSGLFGAERVATTKLLGPGQKSIFYPKRGDSFRVTKDLSRYLPDASYDIVMKNGREIYFRNDDQREDMYIIFNEPLAKGDTLILKVNRGYFRYTTESICKLPTRVKKLLKAAAKRKSAKKLHKKAENGVMVTQKEFCFDDRGDIVPCSSPKATINQKPAVKEPVTLKEPKSQKEAPPKQASHAEPANNIFATFAEKLASAFARIKTTLAENRAREAKETEQRAKEAQKSAAAKNRSGEKTRTASEAEPPRMRKQAAATPAEIEKYAHAPKSIVRLHEPLQTPHFAPIPTEQTRPSFAYEELKLGAVTAPPAIAATPPAAQITASGPAKAPAYRQPEFAKRDRLSPLDDLDTPYRKPQYQTTAPAVASAERAEPSVPISKPQLSRKPVVRAHVPAALPQYVAKAPTLPSRKVTAPKMPAMEPIAKSTADIVAVAPAAEKRVQPVVAPQQPAPQIAQQLGELKVQQPEPEPLPAEAEREESEPADKIVITKTIQAKQPAAQPVEPMERMRDRVLGGGYDAAQSAGRLSVRAYANRKPVSAWVEVYHGKRRVKTFYTGVKKEVKLPEGTYILKATYRTGTSKQKKNLGKVHIKSGESIRKKVYFHIGTLNVVAKKRGKPLYVKVEIFRQGSKSRYAYTFSSRNNGIARLQLAQGRYRIVVREHGDVKTFDNVYVKGNRLKTLVAEF